MPKLRPGSARSGDRVRFHYTVKFTTGSIISTTIDGAPGEMILGKGLAVPGLEKAFRGMLPGERKTITVTSENAFGPRSDQLVIPAPRTNFPQRDFTVGQAIDFTQPDGQTAKGVVRLVDDIMVVFDLNHPLAGHDLVYDLELIEIVERGLLTPKPRK